MKGEISYSFSYWQIQAEIVWYIGSQALFASKSMIAWEGYGVHSALMFGLLSIVYLKDQI